MAFFSHRRENLKSYMRQKKLIFRSGSSQSLYARVGRLNNTARATYELKARFQDGRKIQEKEDK
jgi:hypothetical protein